MHSLDYILSQFQTVILSINNCSGCTPKFSFQHQGTKPLSYMTNFIMKGRRVYTANGFLKEISTGRLRWSEYCLTSSSLQNSGSDCRGKQPSGKTKRCMHQFLLFFSEHKMQSCCICTKQKTAQKISSTGFILDRNPFLSTLKYSSILPHFLKLHSSGMQLKKLS